MNEGRKDGEDGEEEGETATAKETEEISKKRRSRSAVKNIKMYGVSRTT